MTGLLVSIGISSVLAIRETAVIDPTRLEEDPRLIVHGGKSVGFDDAQGRREQTLVGIVEAEEIPLMILRKFFEFLGNFAGRLGLVAHSTVKRGK